MGHLDVAHFQGKVRLDFTSCFKTLLPGKQGHENISIGTCLLESTFIRVRIVIHIYLPANTWFQTCPFLLGNGKLGSSETQKTLDHAFSILFPPRNVVLMSGVVSWLLVSCLAFFKVRFIHLLFFKICGIRLKSCPVKVQIKFWFLFWVLFIFFSGFQRVVIISISFVSIFPKRYVFLFKSLKSES